MKGVDAWRQAGSGRKIDAVQSRTRELPPGGPGAVTGFLAMPDTDEPCPGLVVVHEIFGLNDNMRDIARRFASAGYAALAVDLRSRRGMALCMARAFSAQLSAGRRGTGELRRALTVLGDQPGVDASRLGAVGFCLGGTFVIAWACADSRLRAIAPFYGMNPRPLAAVARSCPVVGSYPGADVTARSGRRLDRALAGHGIEHDVRIYPGAKHSFFNDTLPAHDPSASEDAWERVLHFLDRHVAHRDGVVDGEMDGLEG